MSDSKSKPGLPEMDTDVPQEDVETNMYDHEQKDPSSDDDSSSEDDSELDEHETIREMGMKPRMQRIQRILQRQLMDTDDRISQELREKEEGQRRLSTKREDLGVSLYGAQQQLAKLQQALETVHAKFSAANEERYQSEEHGDEYRLVLEQREKEVGDQNLVLRDHQRELEALNVTCQQIERYNRELQSEIDVTKRAAYKTEEHVGELEKVKQDQDLYIDGLNENIRRLKEELALTAKTLAVQQLETQHAMATIADASVEMDKIAFEKKQLLQQWKSSLLSMSKRNEALSATQEAITGVKETQLSTQSEIHGVRKSLAEAQEQNEVLVATKDRIDAEIEFVRDQLARHGEERSTLAARYAMLQKSMQQTDRQSEQVASATKAVETSVRETQASIVTLQRNRHAAESAIHLERNDQLTVNKAAQNLAKETQKVQETVHEKELTIAQMSNELARVRVDNLNTRSHNDQLRETLAKLVEQLKEKDTTVERHELEIRQRTDEIEKKMLRVDRLNRKLEHLTSNATSAENTGPLEATIVNLQKEIRTISSENLEFQGRWLRVQTQLVSSSAETEALKDLTAEYASKKSILEQRRVRLSQQLRQMEADIASITLAISRSHTEMTKLNVLIAKHATNQDVLEDQNFGLELNFKNELVRLEEQAVKLDHDLDNIKNDKAQLLSEMIEVERQVMLWEKKIQLEKETQAALDPNVGQSEARNMEKEIHRMSIRYEAIQREQEKMLQDMEQALAKHETISIRGRGAKKSSANKASVHKKMVSLEQTIKKQSKDVSKYEVAIAEKLTTLDALQVELETCVSETQHREQEAEALQADINETLFEKQRVMENVARYQRLVKRYENLATGKIRRCAAQDQVKIQNDFAKAKTNLETVQSIVQQLKEEYPHLQQVLTRVHLLSTDV